MYRKFFGLTSLPFKTTPELNMFYHDGSRAQILEALVYTISRGDGIIKVTGEVGSGKTMLLRLLATKLPKSTEIIYINSPNLSAKDILLYICTELKIEVSSFKEKFSLTNALQKKLVELHSQGHKVVMLIDEAQVMTFDALEELRLLSNLETSDDKLLQMVLFGQPELDVAMENDKIRQIKSRISYSIYVPELKVDEVYEYLNYRMRQAGYKGLDVFTLKVAKKIHKLSSGLPRSINVIADKLLMAAFGTGSSVIEAKHFKNLGDEGGGNAKGIKLLSVSLIFAITVLATYFVHTYLNNLNDTSSIKGLPVTASNDVALSSNQDDLASTSNGENNIENQSQKKEFRLDDSSSASHLIAKANENSLPIDQLNAIEVESSKLNPMSVGKEIAQKLKDSNDFDQDNGLQESKTTLSSNLESVNFNSNENYEIDKLKLVEPFKSMHENSSLMPVLRQHALAKTWLQQQTDRYTIQLSTRNIASLEKTIAFYKRNKFDIDKIRILIDLNQSGNLFRIKVFYLSSDSFSELNKVQSRLPEKIKKEGPYIVRIDTLNSKLKRTEEKLNKVGIINE